MDIIEINNDNIEKEHICCAIGSDKESKERSATKKAWLQTQFDNGLVFKRLDARGKVFIEYIPIEKVWKPISGKNYFVINCLWVSGQFKGKGYSTQLLDECINDAKKAGKDGIAVVSSSSPKAFLTDRKFYLKKGFELVDEAAPYFELYVYKINKEAKNPSFNAHAKKAECENKDGFTFIYADQCPFMSSVSKNFSLICEKLGCKAKVIKLESYKDAQKLGSPFGTMGTYYNGKFVTHELMTDKKFEDLVKKLTK